MKMKSRLLVAACYSAIAFSAQAGTILQAASATSSVGSYSAQYLPTFAIDQSGLSATYVSGVTDFDSFVASTGTVAGGSSFNTFFMPASTTTGNFDFYLGGLNTIESFALWNDPQFTANQSVYTFNLLADDNAAFSSPTVLGSYAALEGTTNAVNFGQVFAFAPTSASYVRMEILSNYGSTFTTGFVEGAFEVSAVPEPESYALALAGLGILGFVARRRRQA